MKQACALLERGALWNVFIIAATARALLALYKKRLADTVTAMRAAVEGNGDTRPDPAAMAALYQRLPSIDFSRDIIEGQEAALRVVPVPHCGWTDLGTPQRVAETLRRLPQELHLRSPTPANASYLNLAMQHLRLRVGGSAQAMQGALQ